MFPVMVAESALYAAGVAFVVSFALRFPLSMPAVPTNFAGFWPKAVAAAGAGVYEELLFRGVLLAALYLVARNVLEMNRWVAAVLAIAAASALFSAAHFISGGEVSNWTAFRFRLVAGIALSVVFLARGLGIAAWSHAIYNVWIFSAPPP
jgi:membrane protease YdiL (CAAX protease family)